MNLKYSLLVPMLLLVACNGRYDHGPASGGYGPAEFVSNGERIYFTGSSASGDAISARGDGGPMNMHWRMHGGGCVSCHGADREGGLMWPRFWINAPALTTEALFADDHADDGHGDHGSYDAESLRRAITHGIDPAGKPLDAAMPRWTMSRADLDDLIAYLQQSHGHD